MSGIPYWGSSTFSDIRELNKNSFNILSLSDLSNYANDRGFPFEVEDLHTLFTALAHLDWLFVIPENPTDYSKSPYQPNYFLSWARDVRFNYRDRMMFAPYFAFSVSEVQASTAYQTNELLDAVVLVNDVPVEPEEVEDSDNSTTETCTIALKHSFSYRLHLLDDRDTGFRRDELLVYDPRRKQGYRLTLTGLPYFQEETFSLADMYERYINAAYIQSENFDFDWTKYLRIQAKGVSPSPEQRLRKKFGFPNYFDAFKEYRYQDVRQYHFEELYGRQMRLDSDQPYWRRILDFESYIYCVTAQNAHPVETEYLQQYNELGIKSRHFSYGTGKPLVLKYYYKNSPTLSKKTFERYTKRG